MDSYRRHRRPLLSTVVMVAVNPSRLTMIHLLSLPASHFALAFRLVLAMDVVERQMDSMLLSSTTSSMVGLSTKMDYSLKNFNQIHILLLRETGHVFDNCENSIIAPYVMLQQWH